MNIENFEKQAKALFDRYRPEAENDQIWQNIEPHLKRKKKRRPFILLFWGLALGLLLAVLWRQNASQNSRLASLPGRSPGSPELAEQSPKRETSLVKEPQQAAWASELPATANSGSTTFQPKGVIQNTRTVENLAQHQIAEGAISENDVAVPQSANRTPIPALALEQKAELNANPAPKTELKPTPVDTLANHSELEKKDTPKAKKPSKSKTKPYKKKRSKASIALHGGYVLPIKTLQRNEKAEANGDLLANRKTSEKTLEAFSASAHYTYATKKGLLFRGGLDYKRLNEKFRVSYSKTETEIVNGVLTQTVNAGGQVIAQTTGPKEVTTTTVYSNIAFNNYQFLNVPLGMGFQGLNKKSQWEFAGGLNVNLLFRFDGTLYNEFAQPVSFSHPGYAGIFRKNLGLGMWVSYGYSRYLSRNIRWQLSVEAEMHFKSVTNEKYPLVQRYYNFGLKGGLVFNLTEDKTSKHKKRK